MTRYIMLSHIGDKERGRHTPGAGTWGNARGCHSHRRCVQSCDRDQNAAQLVDCRVAVACERLPGIPVHL